MATKATDKATDKGKNVQDKVEGKAEGKGKKGSDVMSGNPVKANEKLSKAMNGTGSELLGFQVWYDLFGVEVSRDDLLAKLTGIGLDKAMPEDMCFERRLRAAMAKVKRAERVEFKRAGKSAIKVKAVVDGKEVETEQVIVTYRPIQLDKAEDASATSAEHKPTLKSNALSAVSVNTETGVLSFQDPTCSIATKLTSEYQRLQNKVISHQFRAMIASIINSLFGIRLRSRGGIWFIPADDGVEAKLSGLQKVLSEVGSELYMPRLPKGGEWARAAQNATMGTLDESYAEILNDVEGFVASLNEGDLIHTKALNARVEGAKNLKKRAELYSGIVTDRGDTLQKACDLLSTTVQGIFNASVEIRSLNKAKGSELAQNAAKEMLGKIAAETKSKLGDVRKIHEPKLIDDEEENGD